MQEQTKKIIAVGVVAVAAAALIYGSYLPYRKSSAYIAALTNANTATSLDGFLVPFMHALDATSPIGQPELVRHFSSAIGNITQNALSKPGGIQPQVIQVLGASLDKYALPVISVKSGSSEEQTYYALATAYLDLSQATHEPQYQDRAYDLYKAGIARSPDRPQFLYALMSFEDEHGSHQKALEYARHINELWPDDKRISDYLAADAASMKKTK